MLYRRTQIRSYKVIKPFVYAGIQFETDSVFDPKEFNCTVQKVEKLISSRFLDQSAMVPEEEGKKKKVRVQETVKVVQKEPEQVEVPVVEEVPTEVEPQPESVEVEPTPEVVEEPAVATRTTRRRS